MKTHIKIVLKCISIVDLKKLERQYANAHFAISLRNF